MTNFKPQTMSTMKMFRDSLAEAGVQIACWDTEEYAWITLVTEGMHTVPLKALAKACDAANIDSDCLCLKAPGRGEPTNRIHVYFLA